MRTYIVIPRWLTFPVTVVSGAESTLKVGGVFQNFSYFFANFRTWGVTKSRPIDPFLCDICIFECKVWTKKCSNLPFLGAIIYVLHVSFDTFCRRLEFFYSISPKFFDDLFFCSTPHFSFIYSLKIFCRPKNFFTP